MTASSRPIPGGGEFYVGRSGLESRAVGQVSQGRSDGGETSTEEVVVGVITSILTGRLGDDDNEPRQPAQRPAADAQIFLPAAISNLFSLTTELYHRAPGASLELLVYQGSQRTSGYSLLFEPGKNVLLIRRSSRGAAVVQESDVPVSFTPNTIHVLQWTRNADGFMTVSFDGTQVLESDRLDLDVAYSQAMPSNARSFSSKPLSP